MPAPTTRPRIRSLQDVRRATRQSPLDVLNQLVQLQREKERLTQEKQNWQTKLTLIETRLEEIVAEEKKLQSSLAVDEGAGAAPATSGEKSRGASVPQQRAPAEAVNTVTLRY